MYRPNRRMFLQMAGAGVGTMLMSGRSFAAQPVGDGDVYWRVPRKDYETRRRMYLEYCSANSRQGRNGVFSQIARLELGTEPIDETVFRNALDFVYANHDCNDFVLSGFLRILYKYRQSSLLSKSLIADLEECVLKFKYWWDGPGTDDRCYHTENHQIIYHMTELLAGQMFPDKVFENSGKTGRYHIGHATHLIKRWMEFRVKFGFSEWLSNCYFDHDLMALANLYDFAADPDLRIRAEMLTDVLLFEIAINSYHGVFGSTHGRTYSGMIKSGRAEHTQSISKLMFGMGMFNEPDSVGSVTLATSGYRCPSVISAISVDFDRSFISKERHSINIEDAPKYGLSYDKIEDGHLYWSVQDYVNPKIIDLSRRMSETFGVRKFEDYDKYAKQYATQIKQYGKIVNPNLCNKALTEVHIQTCRTPDYMLSCAQDYRPGIPGYQQHIWQATLGIDAVVFTNHPGSIKEGGRPDFWAGNGIMPRAVQHRNVLVCIYNIPADNPIQFSHAYFPRDAFDEVVERGNWTCARKRNGYIALYSQKKTESKQTELRAESNANIWVCEMGSTSDSGSFTDFVKSVTTAPITCEQMRVRYGSPTVGTVEFGWDGPLRVGGRSVPVHVDRRFDNPYCISEFTSPRITIKRRPNELRLDFDNNTRKLV